MFYGIFSRLKLHSFLFLVCFIVAGCGYSNDESEVVVLPKEQRPNIVFILVDDLDAKLNTIDYMKNLQELMIARGTSMDDFLVSTPVCCPSRTTILRGQYTHSHQVYHNTLPEGGFYKFNRVGNDLSHLGTWLQAAGYRTALMGKYLNGYPFRDDRSYFPAGWSEWASPAKKNAYDGYDYVLNENGNLIVYSPDEENYFTDVLSRKATDFIQRAAQDKAPFFLYLSPFAPHAPATPARRHLELFPSITIPYTPSFNEQNVSDKPINMSLNPLLTDKQIMNMNELYRARVLSMQAVDEMLAEIIKVLDQTGQLQNAYIVFTSDNGFHLGQHRLYAGKSTFYEEDIVVPFVVRGPGISQNRIVSGFLAGNVDIPSTIAEWAGVVPPAFVEGRSFAGILSGDSISGAGWRQGYLLEVYSDQGEALEQGSAPSARTAIGVLGSFVKFPLIESDVPTPNSLGIRTNQYLYVRHQDGFVEFYDLISDPYELDNIASKVDPNQLDYFSDWLEALSACKGAQCRDAEVDFQK